MPAPQSETDSVEYVFWFDQDYDNRLSGQFLNDHFLFDVDSLSSGIHILNAKFGNEDDATIKSFLFYKKPHEEIMIVKYEYWLNDLDSTMHSVNITPQDTFDLVSLLQVPHLPIRSTYFQFNPSSGNPTINAKNDIHFKFYNGEGRHALKTKPYVDITVVDTVYADTIERNTTKTVASPINNAIHWFKLGVGVGDSLSFRTDKLCTMQLYAPSGEMVFYVSNDSVLSWNGCHSWEQGDYYLAVHDAADSGTISVSYQWIYRYAVLSWDVHRVGNGGVSTITFEGNGFSSLDTMFLVRGMDTIPTLYIERVSNTTMSVIYNFEGIDTGVYDGTFVYVDENLYKNDVVYVEEAKPIVLNTTCSYPSEFLRGSTVTYTYTITNTGNMTAYQVPMQVYISSNTFNNIQHIDIQGLSLKKLYQYINCFDSLNSEDQAAWIEYSRQIGELHYFIPHINANEDGDSVAIYLGYFFDNIAPYETKTVSISVISFGAIEVWLSLPDDWVALKDSIEENISESGSKSSNHFCCWHDTFETVATEVSTGASAVALAGLIVPELVSKAVAAGAGLVSLGSAVLSFTSQIIAANICQGKYGNERLLGLDGVGLSVAGIGLNIISLIPNVGPLFKGLATFGSMVSGLPSEVDNYANRESVRKSPECSPPEPGPSGGKSEPRVSMDPNEITGYIAESGSHVVGAAQVQMPFIVEFENDTTFATANAHTVVVKDTLDGNVFDLNSFSATSFAIGEKEESVNAVQSFIRTVDMRPAIDVLAQVQLDYKIDTFFAVATWTFSSLDPMTLLPTTDPTLGFLPANFNGDGVGEVNFTINRKANLPDSTLVRNRAYITFDNEAPLPTSIWINIVDNIPPTSTIDSVVFEGETATLAMHATDNLSGVWRYNVYGQLDENTWQPVAMQIPADTVAVFETMEDQFIAFRTTAIDSAGNVESLALEPLVPTVYDTMIVTVCESFVWSDSIYTVSGEYVHTKLSTIPIIADSVTTLYLTVNHGTYNVQTDTVCNSYVWLNELYSTSGTFTHAYINAEGCPSVDTLHLTVNNPVHTAVTETACESFAWNDSVYTESGDYTFSHEDANGCMQVDTLHLTVNYSNTGDTSAIICDSFDWYGITYSESGDYTYTTPNDDGCDSVITLHLLIATNENSEFEIITDDSCYLWNGISYCTSGDYTQTLQTIHGCDSIVTLHLTITVGLDDHEIVDFKVFPNPTTGVVNVECIMKNEQLGEVEIQVVDMYGKLVDVVGGNNHSPLRTARIDLSRYASGVYFVKLMAENKTIAVRKVVKQ